MSSQSGSEFIEYDSECYEVECIRQRKVVKGKKLYLIKWQGWDQKDNTWEPIQNLQTVLTMVNAFQKQLSENGGVRRETEKTSASKQGQSSEGLKKTKAIQKEKKQKKKQQENNEQQSQSESVQVVDISEKKPKRDGTKESKKVLNNNNVQLSMEKQKTAKSSAKEKQREVEKNKVSQKDKDKQKQKEITSNKRNQTTSSFLNNTKSAQPSSSTVLTKQSSKPVTQSFNNSGDIVEITRINYHIMIPPELPHLPAKLFYNIERRNKISHKLLPVIDIEAEELRKKCPQIVIQYLESFVKEVEFYSYQKKEYENRQNLQNQSQNNSLNKSKK